MHYEAFIDLINNKTGLSFSGARIRMLRDSIDLRLKALGTRSVEKYYNLLKESTEETEELVNLLTVNETYFLREPAHLNLFTETIAPAILAGKGAGEFVKILSIGCATGEEPFSIAMKLHKKFGNTGMSRFRITAIDIDSNAVKKAVKGIFRKNSFRSPHKEATDKFIWEYFKELGPRQYKLNDFILKQVEFRQYNLLDSKLSNDFTEMDVIFYRNISIYFDKDTRKKVLTELKKIVRPGGYLITGASETNANDMGLFELTEIDGLFIFRNNGAIERQPISEHAFKRVTNEISEERALTKKQSTYALSGGEIENKTIFRESSRFSEWRSTPERITSTVRENESEPEEKSGERDLYNEAYSLFSVKRYGQALKSVDSLIREENNSVRGYILKAAISINMSDNEAAKEACERVLEIDRWNLKASLYLGIAARHEDKEQEALNHFKSAVYIDPSSWIAHYYMAESYMKRGELNLARREYVVVQRLIEKAEHETPDDDLFLFSFSNEQIMEMCKAKTNQLNSKM